VLPSEIKSTTGSSRSPKITTKFRSHVRHDSVSIFSSNIGTKQESVTRKRLDDFSPKMKLRRIARTRYSIFLSKNCYNSKVNVQRLINVYDDEILKPEQITCGIVRV